MDTHKDLGQWQFAQGVPLMLGTKVRLNHDHELKSDWPDEYVVTGLMIDRDNRLDITIGPSLDSSKFHGCDYSDGWRVNDLVGVVTGVKFSMNGFRRQLSNDVKDLRNIIKDVITGEFYETEDLAEAVNEVITHSNVVNCVYQHGDPDFTDMSGVEVAHIEVGDDD